MTRPIPASLSRSEKFAFARRSALAQLRELPGSVRAVLRRAGDNSALALRADPPDSELTRRTLESAQDVYDPVLLHHCLRCWYLGDLFAQSEHRSYDAELFYIACLLHDIGLTDRYRPTGDDTPCFAIHGGDLAQRELRGWGADDEFARTVSEAIAGHLDITVPPETGIEAHLLHAAARLDVVGARLPEIPRHLIREIHIRHPRTEFVPTFARALAREARERPDSRIAVLWRTGMRIPMTLNPIRTMT